MLVRGGKKNAGRRARRPACREAVDPLRYAAFAALV
jgi:hypothetical protein